jgi:hypothetical protein
MFRATKWAMLAGLALMLAPRASANCLLDPLLCRLTLTFQSDASGLTLGGSGTNSASMSFGTMSAYGGTVPAHVTRTVNGTTNWTISTPFDVTVTCTVIGLGLCGLLDSPNYTLTAQLQTGDTTNSWKINSVTLTNASASTLTSNGTYGSATQYTFSLTIPFTEPAGAISNTINFVAITN